MSLVNDMLRDLDARRREVPTRGLGAEKLVPASERAAKSNARRTIVLVTLLLVLLGGLIVAYLLTIRQSSGQLSMPLAQTSPVNTQNTIVEDGAQSATVVDSSTSSTDPLANLSRNQPVTDVNQLEARLRQLEAQNQALLQAQAQADATARAQQQAQLEQLAVVRQPQIAADAQINREWADAPALPAETAFETPAGQSTNSSATDTQQSASSRVARELSFYDRDRQQVQTALQQWASGQQLTALQTLDRFAFENPQAHYSRETMVKLLIQMGETERAMQAAELGLAIQPGSVVYRKLKARLLLAANTPVEAVDLLAVASPAVSADTEYHDLLASAYLAARQYEGAVGSYQALLQQNSNEARWWYGLAASLDALGRSTDAVAAYEQALKLPALSEALRQASLQRVQAFRQNAAAN
ncbi:MAG: hypothetical protein Q8L06_00555 [Pseudohongiella sp.]|nr:hypothetical protein [Pseudohongiella sp.]